MESFYRLWQFRLALLILASFGHGSAMLIENNGIECQGVDNGYYPDKSTCYAYIQCKSNTAIYFQCRYGLVWNNIDKHCYIGVCYQLNKATSYANYQVVKNSRCNLLDAVSIKINTKLLCAAKCMERFRCRYFQWTQATNTCRLFDTECDSFDRSLDKGSILGKISKSS